MSDTHNIDAIDTSRLRAAVLDGFDQGCNCAESIAAPFAETLGRGREIMGLATPFGSGIGGRRDICGIITGGVLVIGLVLGRTDPKNAEQKSLAYKAAAKYYRWFKERGQVRCSEIVRGKFTGHTGACSELMDGAQAKLIEIIWDGEDDSA